MSSRDAVVTQETRLQGVRGWLLALCLYLTLLIPLLAVLGLVGAWQAAARSATLQNALVYEAVLELGLAGFAFYSGIALYRRRPNATSIAKIYFITMLTLGVLGLGIALVGAVWQLSDRALANQLRGPAVVAGLRQIVLAVAWLLYLERSRRVHATYPAG
ncbi:MAG TPA: DUF2569 family protein [Micropepsaceae bacterium]|jgi:hypothetical protein